jgi:hypothetical protein
MSWHCFSYRRKILGYFEGEISQRSAIRLEKHLLDCRKCRELFSNLQVGHQAGLQFGRIGPEINQNPPEFEELWENITTKFDGLNGRERTKGSILRRLYITPILRIFVTLGLAGLVILLVFNGKALWRIKEQVTLPATALKYRDFTPVSISEFASETRSPIVTEGFVRDIYFDKKEKTLHIKLVELPHKSEPFVICEILSPGEMTIPQEGNRIRVYGMARFDAQPGRGWHEVNPVLTVAVLKH